MASNSSFEDSEEPPITFTELRQILADRKVRVLELQNVPNFLTADLQRFKELKNRKEELNRLNRKEPTIEKEYRKLEREIATILMDIYDVNDDPRARINEKEWMVVEIVPKLNIQGHDNGKLIEFLKENKLLDLLKKNEVIGTRINKEGRVDKIRQIEFDKKGLIIWLKKNKLARNLEVPEFLNLTFDSRIKIRKHPLSIDKILKEY